MTLAFALTRCAPRKHRLTLLTWVTRLTVFLAATALAGWLLTFIKHIL
jgi:hypothetical protein